MAELVTRRLRIRRFRATDWREMQDYVSRPDVTRYDHEYPTSDEACRSLAQFFAGNDGFWAVCLQEAGQLIGHVVCTRKEPAELMTWQLGFVFNPSYHGRGYATEACHRVLEHVFVDQGAYRVESACHPDNIPSWRLMERLGMRCEARHVKSGFLRRPQSGDPIWWDSRIYAILADEWRSVPTLV